MKKQKTLSTSSILIICMLCLFIGFLAAVIACFAWVYNTPNIKEAFTATYFNKDKTSLADRDFGNVLNGTVELTIPAFFYELSEEPFDYQLNEEAKENGFIDIQKNEDGSATYTMKKKDYKEFIAKFKKSTKESFDELLSSGLYPSVQKIEYSDNFEKITITANKAEFENSFESLMVTTCGLTSYSYQLFDINSSKKCTIEVKDSTSGEIFQTLVYPDYLTE